ncbi:MAG: portal protein [Phycisphaerae bacterium]|nr:portal protein [Phycisphaerae bacterium]
MFWEDKTLYDRIIDRLTQQAQKYIKWRTAQDKIIEIFRSDMGIESSLDGDFFGADIYESTPAYALEIMSTAFRGSTVSEALDWIRYGMGAFELRGIDKLDQWCQDIRDHMTAVYRRSNFYDVLPQFTKDAFSIGSPVMFGGENIVTRRIMWMPTYYKHTFLFYDKYNESEGVIVNDTEWTAKQVFDTFINKEGQAGKDAREKKLSVSLNNSLEQGQFNDKATIIRAVFKANDPIWNNKNFKKPAGRYKWISVFFELGTEEKNKNTPLNEDMGFFTQPYVYWNYDKKSQDSSARTPAFYAVFDAMSGQDVYKDFLENMKNQNRPAVMALNEMKGRLDMGPEGLIWVDKEEYMSPPKTLDLIGQVNFTKELADLLGETCKRHFHVNEFQAMNNLARTNKQPVSALQILKMDAENSILLSPAIESQRSVLRMIDERMMGIEIEAGNGPFAPEVRENITDIILENIKDRRIATVAVIPEFISQLGRAQKIAQALEPITMGIDIAADMAAKLDLDLVMAVKGYKALDKAYTAMGFPMDCLATEEEYMAAKEFVNKQRAADKQAMQAVEMMKASKNIQGPVDPNSVLAGAGKAMAGAVI